MHTCSSNGGYSYITTRVTLSLSLPVNSEYVVDAQVTLKKKALLNALFDESDSAGVIEVVGDSPPGNMMVNMNR